MFGGGADAGHLPRGDLSVGWFSTLAPVVMPELASSFLKTLSEVRLRSIESNQDGLLAALRRAEVEVALTYDLKIEEDIAFAPLATLPPYVLLGASHPLARERELKLAQLAPLPMVLLDMPVSREYFLGLFIRERLEPTIAWSSGQMDAVRTLVANGLGYTLANARPRADVALDGRRLRRVPLSGDLPPVRIGIATLKELRKTRLAEAFERHCTERDHRHPRSGHGRSAAPQSGASGADGRRMHDKRGDESDNPRAARSVAPDPRRRLRRARAAPACF